MKLGSFLNETFSRKYLTNETQYPKVLDTSMHDCLDYMFPGESFAHFYVRDIVNDIKKSNIKDIHLLDVDSLFNHCSDSRNLIFHMRDVNWLTRHLRYYIDNFSFKGLENVGFVSLSMLQDFVANSPVFDAKRSEFEKYIVKAYIEECIDCKSDDFYSRSIEKILESGSPNYDKLFRSRVVNAMKFLGIGDESIETGLELNAPLWRKDVMDLSFANRYKNNLNITYTMGHYLQIPDEDLFDKKSVYHNYSKKAFIEEAYVLPRESLNGYTRSIYDKWFCLREYEYYHNHKKTIDKLNTATRNMKISRKQAKKIYAMMTELEAKMQNQTEKSR